MNQRLLKQFWLKIFCLPVVMLAISNSAVAETLSGQCITEAPCEEDLEPLWEVGAAGVTVNSPDYPGSDENSNNTLAIPYFVYRGEVIRAGEDGLVKAHAFEDERFELDISIDGAFDADSDDNDAREGMEDLDYLFGIGPELQAHLFNDQQTQQELTLELQARAVFSTDLSDLSQRGYAFESRLKYERERLFGEDIKLFAAVGPVWGTEKLMNYFYQVNPRDVTAERERFDAKGGYLGTDLSVGLVFGFWEKKARLFVGGSANFLNGAENEDSPLFRDDTTYSVGIGFAYRLIQSERMVSGR